MPFAQLFPEQIVNVQWGLEEQVLISIEKGDDTILYNIDEVEFRRGRTAASGLGYTVISDGYIAFGGVRDEDSFVSCFIASHAASTDLSKGTIKTDDLGQTELVWTSAGGVPGDEIRGISFCNGFFFITSRQIGDPPTLYITYSTDAKKFKSSSFMSGADDCGTVACNLQDKDNPIYCCVGMGPGGDPNYSVHYSATSRDGLSWSDGRGSMAFSEDAPQVAFGKGTFVSGGFNYSVVTEVIDDEEFLVGTGQALSSASKSGSNFSPGAALAIPGGTAKAASFGGSAIFAKGRGKEGYFVLIAEASGEDSPDSVVAFKSSSGSIWSRVGSWGRPDDVDSSRFGSLSVIAKDPGKIRNF